ncbi:glycosyltransferase family 4 protein [Geodermatophilus sp. SYSU D00684]
MTTSPGTTGDLPSTDVPGPSGLPSRVLWVTNLPAPYRLAVWDELIRRGVDLEVWVVATNGTNRRWSEGASRPYVTVLPARVFHVGEGDVYLARVSVLELARRLAGRDAVVIGGWDLGLYWRVALVAAVRRLPRVVFYESIATSHRFTSGPVAWLRRLFLSRAADVVLVPGVAAETAVKAHGVPASSIVTTFNSVDHAAVRSAVEEVTDERTASPFRYCYAGQLIERKNVAALLEAFWTMEDRNAELHLVGEGVLRDELEALSRRLAPPASRRRVVWHGGLAPEAAIRQIATAHVLVLPSTTEVWGLVVNEALAAGLSTVVSRACGVAPSVADMAGVFLCDTTPASIREAMETAAAEWSGWIADPEILRAGSPARFADDSMSAVRRAVSRHRGSPGGRR